MIAVLRGYRPLKPFPLRVHLATAFIALTVAVGSVTVYHSYQAGAQLVLAASEETFAHAARETSADVRSLIEPARLQLDLVARHSLGTASSAEQRFAALPLLAAALDGNTNVSAIRVGYESGDLFELQRAASTLKERDAATRARYVITHAEQSPVGSVSRHFVLDGHFAVLSTADDHTGDVDPRYQRWFHQATDTNAVTRTDMSVLSSGSAGTTLSRRFTTGRSVIAFDITVDTLSARLKMHRLTPATQIALIDRDGRVIAHPDRDRLVGRKDRRGRVQLPTIFDTGDDALGDLYRDAHGSDVDLNMSVADREWIGFARVLLSDVGDPVTLLLAVPRDELLTEVREAARAQLLTGMLLVLLALPLAWQVSRRISKPLEQLAKQTQAIRSFEFAPQTTVRSRIIEVDDLARSIDAMRSTIRQFLETSATLAAENRLDRLLERIVADTVRVTGSARGALYLVTDDGQSLRRTAGHGTSADNESEFPDRLPIGTELTDTAQPPATQPDRPQMGHVVITTPLKNRNAERIGALRLALTQPVGTETSDDLAPLVAFVEALSGVAAVAIETTHHVEAQRKLLYSLIELLASAIDAKSPYTGGHCQRVPAIARLLAQAACDVREGPLRDFTLDEVGWETLHIASWLHDCGKVTTPEYVVDKATKLETLHNRIHEVRARFEILKRDAEIACWKIVAGGADAHEARSRLDATWRELDDDFTFIAQCNIGGESMASEDIARVRRIAQRTWMRTLDDRIGLSEEERRRLADLPPAPLPATETVLADRPEHRIARRPEDTIAADNPWGFRLTPPEHRLNLGEIHSLCVRRGTLTPEERYLINDHIVQSIIMLSKLPFPRHLQAVPEVACGHHEKMDGTGYPRGLRGAEMSTPARILAIADVFEALTASDRPYKPGKSMDETLQIMRSMAQTGHIDPDLFSLFVEADIPKQYAEQFLVPAPRHSTEAAL